MTVKIILDAEAIKMAAAKKYIAQEEEKARQTGDTDRLAMIAEYKRRNGFDDEAPQIEEKTAVE